MRRLSPALTGIAALTAVFAAVPTAYAIDFPAQPHTIRNAATGACLGEEGRQVRMDDCSGSKPTTWQIRQTESGDMLRNITSTSCLDTDGVDVYLSDCNASDLGQRWYVRDCGVSIFSRLAYERGIGDYLTGWNAGTASVTGFTAGKSEWRVSDWSCED
ncbi:ricin-type beta-trefoil lectin domain protein [Streptomyces sp. NBC_00102]|uniref:ricin-type beta-trefoil lectin domain protein n=1 Tax=Streptomyces sp. NBC_00102 TaxID=2975652 RepID=UPI002256FE23|nr:ricin-type beta-trefoil lectin domain protein [Streptomyces sp. NBC_00102]MCX5400471.1 RICIN domain-containing protein [Streptomyces sp. NBC_00102]